jgi:hypothetical protein
LNVSPQLTRPDAELVLSPALSEACPEQSRRVEGKVEGDDEGRRNASGNRQWTGSLRKIREDQFPYPWGCSLCQSQALEIMARKSG